MCLAQIGNTFLNSNLVKKKLQAKNVKKSFSKTKHL